MKEDKKDTSPEQTEERGAPMDHPGGNIKIPRPTQVNVSIWESDAHYLASFNHSPRRVFHNVEELLLAIQVEVKRLGGTLGG